MSKVQTRPKPAEQQAATDILPLADTVRPPDAAGVAEAVRAAGGESRPVYPLGGRTSLDFGLLPSRPGVGLDLTAMNRVVDYTPRDMTIVVEPGMRVAELATTLAAETQWLPIDVPRAAEATLGGAVATNWNGARRYGHGTWRDYIIGISAVDGRGTPFKAGGRVVKNVAGYDFCKLLTGSLGSLGVITQLVLRVKPRPVAEASLVAPCASLHQAEQALDALSRGAAAPSVLELLVGPAWASVEGLPESDANLWLLLGVEGTPTEVDWMLDDLAKRLSTADVAHVCRMEAPRAATVRQAAIEFSDRGPGIEPDRSPLVIKAVVPPSATVAMVRLLLETDPRCEIQCHAGSGVVVARFAEFSPGDLTRQLVGRLRPAAIHRGGSLVVASSTLEGLSAPILWGGRTAAHSTMERVKRAFDPHRILNPGRLGY